MKKFITLSLSLSLIAVPCFFCGFDKKKEKENKVMPANGFAVVELFTSEGCSSCPPADEAVMQLEKDNPKNVYVLGFHVDYWDYIGWKDVFSSASFTDRQKQYAKILNVESIYTPQIIVNGKKEFVGSNRSVLQSSVNNELAGNVSATIIIKPKNVNNETIDVGYNAGSSPNSVLNIALVQLQAESNVKRGENKGRVLRHVDIVRDLKTIPGSNEIKGNVSFNIPKDVPVKGLKIVAFLQNKNDWKITGAGDAVIE